MERQGSSADVAASFADSRSRSAELLGPNQFVRQTKGGNVPDQTTLKRDLLALCAAATGGEKKPPSSNKLVDLFSNIVVFRVAFADAELFRPLANLLEVVDDARVVSLLYYVLARFHPHQVPDDLVFRVLSREVDHGTLVRRMTAMQTLSLLTSDAAVVTDLLPVVSAVLRSTATAIPEARSKRQKRRLFARKDTDYIDNVYMQLSAVRAARLRLPLQLDLLTDIMNAACGDDALAARHALAFLASLSQHHPAPVAAAVLDVLPSRVKIDPKAPAAGKGPRPRVLLLTDALAYHAFLRVLGNAAFPDATGAQQRVEGAATLAGDLIKAAEREDLRHVLDAVRQLARGPWTPLAQARVSVRQAATGAAEAAVQQRQSEAAGKAVATAVAAEDGMEVVQVPLLQHMCKRIAQALTAPDTSLPVLHACCRTVAAVARAYYRDTDAAAHASHPLSEALSPVLTGLLDQDAASRTTLFVRAAALRALVWVTPTASLAQRLIPLLLRDVQDATLPKPQLAGIFDVLRQRVAATPSVAECVVDASLQWLRLVPASVDLTVLLALWKQAVRGLPPLRQRLLSACFAALDELSDYPSSSSDLRTGIVWFLGEHGNALCNELPHRYSRTGVQSEASLASAATQNSVNPFADPVGGSGGSGGAAGIAGMEDTAAGTCVYDSANAAMRALLLRLETLAFASSWDTRCAALRGLIKLAYRTGDPVRLRVYEVLVLAEQSARQQSTRSIVSPALAVLDMMYQTQSKLTGLPSDPGAVPPLELQQLLATHEQVVALVQATCPVPQRYQPFGRIGVPYLKLAWEQRRAQQQAAGH